MKKFLMVAAAATLYAGAASAQTATNTEWWRGQAYGNDAAAHWQLNSDVGPFCKLTASQAGPTQFRGQAVPGTNGRGGSAAFSDGTINFANWNPATDTGIDSQVDVDMPNSVCNYRFNIVARSDNGGLRYTGPNASTDPDFTNLVTYAVRASFDNISIPNTPIAAGDNNLATNQQPTAGLFRFTVDLNDTNQLLLEGDYVDFLRVEIVPAA
jgi:hypothetical protein